MVVLNHQVENVGQLERRTAITAPLYFVVRGSDTDVAHGFEIAERLINDPVDVVHNAVGIFPIHTRRRDPDAQQRVLDAHAATMPLAGLRLAIATLTPDPARPLSERFRVLRVRTNSRSRTRPVSPPCSVADDVIGPIVPHQFRTGHRLEMRRTLRRVVDTRASERELTNRLMLRARDAMDRDHRDDLDIATLAGVACVSQAHFIRTFKATFGETPHRYLQRRRVERAMYLLRTTGDDVTDICMAVGFSSLGTFSRTFRDIVGESPTAYRADGPLPMVPSCFVKAWTRPSSFGEAARKGSS